MKKFLIRLFGLAFSKAIDDALKIPPFVPMFPIS